MPSIEAGCEPGESPRRDTLRRGGPILEVEIGFDPDRRPTVRRSLPKRRWTALVDTGANASCIDATVAAQLGLPVVGSEYLAGATGSTSVDDYSAQIVVSGLDTTLTGNFLGAPLREVGYPFDVVLGRDFLSDFNMNYDGPSGSVIISKRDAQG